MFLRFVTFRIDPDSGRREGLVRAAEALAKRANAAPHDHDRIWTVYDWLNANLAVPERLAISRRPHARARALCWFKDSAVEHVARLHELASVLHENGVPVDVLRTRRPGYVVAEDVFQVAAYPFADTPT